MRIRVGLESTKILLTEVGKKWFLEHYTQGIVYEYDPDKPFDLKSLGSIQGIKIRTDFVEILCPLGIPYRLPTYVDGEITFKMADQKAEVE